MGRDRAAAALLLGLLGCGTGSVGEALRTEAPTAGEALGESSETVDCKNVGNTRPLIVDWTSQARLDLELAMKDGVAVVHYGCDGFTVLPRCSMPGAYAFVGVSRKEDVIQLTSADELAANLPLSAAKLSAEMSRDSSLDLALVMVGKRTTSVAEVPRLLLNGECDGATHFVRAATIGAFAMDRGSQGQARAVADLFGAGAKASSASSSRRGAKDGELGACRTAKSSDETPPDQCQAAMRLDLAPLVEGLGAGKKGAQKEAQFAAEEICPPGLVARDGKCARPTSAADESCDPDDVEACRTKCDAGNAESCHFLSGLYLLGRGVNVDEQRFFELSLKACDAGHLKACSSYGFVQFGCQSQQERAKKGGKPPPHACGKRDPRQVLSKACDAADGDACSTLAMTLPVGKTRTELRERACKLGKGDDCVGVGKTYLEGRSGVEKDPGRAVSFFSIGCDGGSSYSCSTLAQLFREGGDGVARDTKAAAEIDERMCAQGGVEACLNAGHAYEKAPPGVSRDLGRAERLYRAACRSGAYPREDVGKACARLGSLIRRKHKGGLPEDAEREMLAAMADGCTLAGIGCPQLRRRLEEKTYAERKAACVKGDAEACTWLQGLVLERGCEQDDERACKQLRIEDDAAYRRARRRRCARDKRADSKACVALRELGEPMPFDTPPTPG